MGNIDASEFQGYLVGQVIASSVGAILLAVGDFGGYYYFDYYNKIEIYGYIFLGSGFFSSILILLGIGGLLFALHAAVKSLKAKDDFSMTVLKENAHRSIKGAGFTAALSAIGAILFIVNSSGTEFWLDSGFYGAFIGGLLTYYFGKQILEKIKE